MRNAVDRPTAEALASAFTEFEKDPKAAVAVLYGEGGYFCAGADLKGVAEGRGNRATPPAQNFNPLSVDAPMGPTRMRLSKPVIAAVAGHAVAGGLELACWCDLRVVEEDAVLLTGPDGVIAEQARPLHLEPQAARPARALDDRLVQRRLDGVDGVGTLND